MRTSTREKAPARQGVRANVRWLLMLGPLALAVGALSAWQPRTALLVIVVACGAGAAARRPVAVAVIALPACWAIQDVGLGPSLGVSDALIAGAAVLALPALRATEARERISGALRAGAVYLVLLTPSLVASLTGPAVTEWVHRALLILASVLVGAWLRQEQALLPGLRLLTLVSCLIGAVSVVDALASGFEPAFPWGYHKNYAGSLLALTLLLVISLPNLASRMPRFVAIVLLACGTVATQSRGAVLGAVLGILIWLFVGRRVQSRGRSGRALALVLATAFSVYTAYSVQQQLTSENRATNSIGVREDVEASTRELWEESPLLGVGVRYYRTDEFTGLTASNNALNSEMAEAGVIGTTGFILLHGAVLLALWRRRRDHFGVAALALFAGNLLHGMFDIYWSSGITPLPYLLVGVALAGERPVRR